MRPNVEISPIEVNVLAFNVLLACSRVYETIKHYRLQTAKAGTTFHDKETSLREELQKCQESYLKDINEQNRSKFVDTIRELHTELMEEKLQQPRLLLENAKECGLVEVQRFFDAWLDEMKETFAKIVTTLRHETTMALNDGSDSPLSSIASSISSTASPQSIDTTTTIATNVSARTIQDTSNPLDSPEAPPQIDCQSLNDPQQQLPPPSSRPNNSDTAKPGGNQMPTGSTQSGTSSTAAIIIQSNGSKRKISRDGRGSAKTKRLCCTEAGTVEFQEVQTDEVQRWIYEWPKGSEIFYIFRCRDCNLEFKMGSLNAGVRAAAIHAASPRHGAPKRDWNMGVAFCGYRVLNVTKDLVDHHNRQIILPQSQSKGSRQLELGRLTHSQPTNEELLPNTSSEIINPKILGLYAAYWGEEDQFYPVRVLSVNRDAQMRFPGQVDLHSIYDTSLVNDIPSCYALKHNRYIEDGQWIEEYQDGGEMVDHRVFAVQWFDEGYNLSWLPATSFRDFEAQEKLEATSSLKSFYDHARAWFQKVLGQRIGIIEDVCNSSGDFSSGNAVTNTIQTTSKNPVAESGGQSSSHPHPPFYSANNATPVDDVVSSYSASPDFLQTNALTTNYPTNVREADMGPQPTMTFTQSEIGILTAPPTENFDYVSTFGPSVLAEGGRQYQGPDSRITTSPVSSMSDAPRNEKHWKVYFSSYESGTFKYPTDSQSESPFMETPEDGGNYAIVYCGDDPRNRRFIDPMAMDKIKMIKQHEHRHVILFPKDPSLPQLDFFFQTLPNGAVPKIQARRFYGFVTKLNQSIHQLDTEVNH